MSYKFYVTDWIPDLGRYAIIISTRKDGPNIAAEAFVFALDTKPFFGGKRLTYPFDETQKTGLNEDDMIKTALGQAQGIIHIQMANAYRKTKNVDLYRRGFEPHEFELGYTILTEIREKYEKKLKELAEESWAEDLRQYLSTFLRIVIKVEPYKPQ